MSKTFNIYCDESCHLENDHKKYMLLGCVSSAYNQVKRHTQRIKELKEKQTIKRLVVKVSQLEVNPIDKVRCHKK